MGDFLKKCSTNTVGRVGPCIFAGIAACFPSVRSPLVLSSLAFASVMAASSAMNNLFVTYYIDLFSRAASLPPEWFYLGQVAFSIWNAVNDPLFGWLSDTFGGASRKPQTIAGNARSWNDNAGEAGALSRRTHALRLGGAGWALAFAIIWWPWGVWSHSPNPGADATTEGLWSPQSILAALHFVVALCFYDGMLSYVEVNHSALLAEMTDRPEERARANMYAGIAAALGSGTSFIAYVMYDTADLTHFRVLVLVVAIACLLIFEFAAWGIDSTANARSPAHASHSVKQEDDMDVTENADDVVPRTKAEKPIGYMQFAFQLVRSRSFLAFVVLASLQSFDCAFEKNFYAPFMDVLTFNPSYHTIRSTSGSSRVLSGQLVNGGGGVTHGWSTRSDAADAVRLRSNLQHQQQVWLKWKAGQLDTGTAVANPGGTASHENAVEEHQRTKSMRGMFISASFILPHVLTIMWTPLIKSQGLYFTLKLIFSVRLLVLIAASSVGRESSAAVLVVSRPLLAPCTHASCSCFAVGGVCLCSSCCAIVSCRSPSAVCFRSSSPISLMKIQPSTDGYASHIMYG
jgi:hypothetical protein